MKLNKKYLLIGAGVVAVSVGTYLFMRNKRNHNDIGILDDETVDFDFSNANGAEDYILQNAVSLSVKDYKKSVEQTLSDKKYARFIGKKVYTLQDNVNIRMGANVNNGIINNIAGTIPNKKSFIGKIVSVKLGDDGKLWFGVDEENSNKLFEVKRHFSWSMKKGNDKTLRWFRSDVVVVNLNK